MGLKFKSNILRLNKKNSSMEGMVWTFAERICAQLVSTVVGIILARLLAPNDYGIISIVMIFITICNVFVTRGFGTTLVQKKDADDLDYNTAFYMSTCLGIILYLILFMSAPLIAEIYRMKQLTAVIRVLGIRVPIAALNTVQQAYIQRTMQFRKFFVATLIGTLVSCVAGIAMAYHGYGVWALVAQYLTNVIIDTVVLSFVSGWRPGIKFSYERVHYIWSFGGKILLSDLISSVTDNFRNLIAGKAFGPEELAFLDQGNKYTKLLTNNITASIQKVMLPSFSKTQDDLQRLKNSLRHSVNVGVFVVTPVLVGFAAVSNNFIRVILTDKWIPAMPFICIACASYLSRPFETMCHQAILALGGSGVILKILVFTNCTDIILTLVAALGFHSLYVMAFTAVLTEICSIICSCAVTRKRIVYGFREQLSDTVPYLLISGIMGVVVYFIGNIPINRGLIFIVQIVAGIVLYIGLSAVFRLKAFVYFKTVYKSKMSGKNT